MSRAGRLALVAAVLATATVVRWRLIHQAAIEPDEFQHLHAAFLVATGARPYVDFFEHHAPLFYVVGGALIDPARASFDTVLRFREGVLVLHVVGMIAGVALAWRHGARVASVAAVLLVGEFFSFAFGSTVLLDAIATPLVLVGAAVLVWRPRSIRAWLAAGVLHGIALLLTQKAVYGATAPLLWWLVGSRPRPSWRAPVAFVVGLVATVALTFAALGAVVTRAFWESAIVLNLHWTARRWPRGELFMIASYAATIWTLAGIGLLRAVGLAWRRLTGDGPTMPLAAVYVLTMVVGVLVTPVVWYEYFVEIGPFVAVLAAWMVEETITAAEGALPPRWVGWTVAATAVAAGVDLLLRLASDHYSPRLSVVGCGLAVAGTALALRAALRAWEDGRGERLALWSAVAVACVPLVLEAGWFDRLGCAQQRAGVQWVLANSAPTDRVFDGYSGFGVFRPHAYRYWFLHDEVLAMLRATPPGPDDDIVAALAEPSVRIVVADPYTRSLGPTVWRAIEAGFEPRWHGMLWLRRDSSAGGG